MIIKKYTLLIHLVFLGLFFSACQENVLPTCINQSIDVMLKFNKKSKIGCINKEGTIIIPPIYHKIGPFSEGLAAVSIYDVKNPNYADRNGISGYINRQGKVVIPLEFLNNSNNTGQFSEGLAAINSNDKYGYINKTGEIEIAPQFTKAYPFSDGVAVVELAPDDYAVIDKKGTILFQFLELYRKEINPSAKNCVFISHQYNEGLISISSSRDEKINSSAVFDTKGNLVFKSDFARIKPYKNGIAVVADTTDLNTWNWGCIDKKGKVIIPPKFKSISSFYDGIAVVKDADTNKMGIINKKGEYVAEPIYVKIFPDTAALFRARKGTGLGLIDKNGQVMVGFEYDYIAPFSECVALAYKGAVTKCIDQSGSILFESTEMFWENNDQGFFTNGLAKVYYKGKEVFINKQGKVVPIK